MRNKSSHNRYDLDFSYTGESGGITETRVKGYVYAYKLRPEDRPTIKDFSLNLTFVLQSVNDNGLSVVDEETMCTVSVDHDFGDAHNFLADLFRDLDKEIILEVIRQEKAGEALLAKHED
jgi:hypothetical protein